MYNYTKEQTERRLFYRVAKDRFSCDIIIHKINGEISISVTNGVDTERALCLPPADASALINLILSIGCDQDFKTEGPMLTVGPRAQFRKEG